MATIATVSDGEDAVSSLTVTGDDRPDRHHGEFDHQQQWHDDGQCRGWLHSSFGRKHGSLDGH